MPGSTALTFTGGSSLNSNQQIQIDSNGSSVGGVMPTQPVPNTSSNLISFFAGTDVELQFAEQVIDKCKAGL